MTSRAALFAVSLLALPGLGASCGPGGDKDAGVDCGALGLTLDVLAPGGSYLPFASAAEAELVLAGGMVVPLSGSSAGTAAP